MLKGEYDIVSDELVISGTIDEIIKQQKDETYKHIRRHRNELMGVMEQFGNCLPVMDSLKIQQFIQVLNAIDYLIDKEY